MQIRRETREREMELMRGKQQGECTNTSIRRYVPYGHSSLSITDSIDLFVLHNKCRHTQRRLILCSLCPASSLVTIIVIN